MTLENRITRLEDNLGAYPKHWTAKDMTDDELAQLITGKPDAKAADLSDADLEAIVRGAHP